MQKWPEIDINITQFEGLLKEEALKWTIVGKEDEDRQRAEVGGGGARVAIIHFDSSKIRLFHSMDTIIGFLRGAWLLERRPSGVGNFKGGHKDRRRSPPILYGGGHSGHSQSEAPPAHPPVANHLLSMGVIWDDPSIPILFLLRGSTTCWLAAAGSRGLRVFLV